MFECRRLNCDEDTKEGIADLIGFMGAEKVHHNCSYLKKDVKRAAVGGGDKSLHLGKSLWSRAISGEPCTISRQQYQHLRNEGF